jgi:ribose-phosphate pyrophosphokinase
VGNDGTRRFTIAVGNSSDARREQWRGCTLVLVDDIASTALTMVAAVARIHEASLNAPWCIAVHPLFAGSAYADLCAAGVAGVVSSNTVAHQSNGIDMSGALVDAVDQVLRTI